MTDALEQAIEQAARIMLNARYVTALVGAGMSVESGIPPFRGPGGIWTKRGSEPSMRGYERFLNDPQTWWETRMAQRAGTSELGGAIAQARPNPGHYALVDLERMGIMRCIITQNIDNLHYEAGTKEAAEIHGNSFKLRCIRCHFRCDRGALPLDELPPKCPQCGGIVKTDTVMFGEPIPSDVLARCQEEAFQSDCMLALGTSAVVYPAASFPLLVKQREGCLIEVNPLETALSDLCDIIIRAPTGEALPLLVQKIESLRSEGA